VRADMRKWPPVRELAELGRAAVLKMEISIR
jgi:hypothetical protein